MITSYSDLELSNRLLLGTPDPRFPDEPEIGMSYLIDGVVYVYLDFDGFFSWFPVGNKREYIRMSQSEPNQTWIIRHNLDRPNLEFIAYTNNNEYLTVLTSEALDKNTLALTFSHPVAGWVLVMTSALGQGMVNIENMTVDNLTVNDGANINQLTVQDDIYLPSRELGEPDLSFHDVYDRLVLLEEHIDGGEY